MNKRVKVRLYESFHDHFCLYVCFYVGVSLCTVVGKVMSEL